MKFIDDIKEFLDFRKYKKSIPLNSEGLYRVIRLFLNHMLCENVIKDPVQIEILQKCVKNLDDVIKHYNNPNKSTVTKLSSTTEYIRKNSLDWK